MDLFGHSRVHCRNGVIEEIDIGVGVEGPRQRKTRLLTARKRDPSLTHHCPVALLQDLEVLGQARQPHCFLVLRLFEGSAEQNVAAHGVREDYCLLLHVGY